MEAITFVSLAKELAGLFTIIIQAFTKSKKKKAKIGRQEFVEVAVRELEAESKSNANNEAMIAYLLANTDRLYGLFAELLQKLKIGEDKEKYVIIMDKSVDSQQLEDAILEKLAITTPLSHEQQKENTKTMEYPARDDDHSSNYIGKDDIASFMERVAKRAEKSRRGEI